MPRTAAARRVDEARIERRKFLGRRFSSNSGSFGVLESKPANRDGGNSTQRIKYVSGPF